MNEPFDIAISYASAEAWIAKDLYDLLVPYGYRVYCYDRMPDESRGFLRENLRDIYLRSGLNLLLWSQAYATAPDDSFPTMERRFLVHRHVNKGESITLIPISVDDYRIASDLELMLVHRLRDNGVLGIEQLTVERLRELRKRPTNHGVVFHPLPTDKYRGELYACEFSVDTRFQNDPLNRWQDLGDVWVRYPNEHGTKYVYLIPSGLCTAFLRHTVRLRTRPDYLEAKRLASIAFAERVRDRNLAGFWFLSRSPKAPERNIVTIYCPEYDRFLNEHFTNAFKLCATRAANNWLQGDAHLSRGVRCRRNTHRPALRSYG